MLFTLGADCPSTADLNELWLITPAGQDAQPQVPLPALWADETVPAGWLEGEVAWWNDRLGCEALCIDEYGEVLVDVGYVSPYADGDLLDLDDDGETAERAHVEFDADGFVVSGTITISSDIAYNESTARLALRHAIGHVPLALADDPGPPMTVDLRSTMGSPNDPLGDLLEADRAALLEAGVCP